MSDAAGRGCAPLSCPCPLPNGPVIKILRPSKGAQQSRLDRNDVYSPTVGRTFPNRKDIPKWIGLFELERVTVDDARFLRKVDGKTSPASLTPSY